MRERPKARSGTRLRRSNGPRTACWRTRTSRSACRGPSRFQPMPRSSINTLFFIRSSRWTDGCARWRSGRAIRALCTMRCCMSASRARSGWRAFLPASCIPYRVGDIDAITRARQTTADILAVYTPGAPVMICPEGMAKKIPAGSDLVLQLHYTSKNTATTDQTEIRMVESTDPPQLRLLDFADVEFRTPAAAGGSEPKILGFGNAAAGGSAGEHAAAHAPARQRVRISASGAGRAGRDAAEGGQLRLLLAVVVSAQNAAAAGGGHAAAVDGHTSTIRRTIRAIPIRRPKSPGATKVGKR